DIAEREHDDAAADCRRPAQVDGLRRPGVRRLALRRDRLAGELGEPARRALEVVGDETDLHDRVFVEQSRVHRSLPGGGKQVPAAYGRGRNAAPALSPGWCRTGP